MFAGMQGVTMRHMRMMGGSFVVPLLMGVVSFPMMMGSGFKMKSGLFMMIMLGHRGDPPDSTRYALPPLNRPLGRAGNTQPLHKIALHREGGERRPCHRTFMRRACSQFRAA
jgi:hypothetical protein